jgi:hypothetical protein
MATRPSAESAGRSRRCRKPRRRRSLRPSCRAARPRRSIPSRSRRRCCRPAIGASTSGHATATALPARSAVNASRSLPVPSCAALRHPPHARRYRITRPDRRTEIRAAGCIYHLATGRPPTTAPRRWSRVRPSGLTPRRRRNRRCRPWSPAPPQRNPGPADQTRYGPASTGSPEPARTDQPGGYGRGDGHPAQRKEGSSTYIDQELRTRVDGDIAAFLTAFDAALLEDTQESRAALREATDRLLRAGARTRIELERLEARMPLPPRDGGRQSEPVWRQR